MKNILNKKFWKYFVITFLVVQFFSVLFFFNEFIDTFLRYLISWDLAIKYTLTASSLMIPTSLSVAVCLSSFMTFRSLPQMTILGFLPKLGVGLVAFFILGVGLYCYDNSVQPELKAKTMEMYWDVKNSGYKVREGNFDYMKTPDFRNEFPSAASSTQIRFKVDSLENEQVKAVAECDRLLALLPNEYAQEAYEGYAMEQYGISYPSSTITDISADSLQHIQNVLLVDEQNRLCDNNTELVGYNAEKYFRMLDAGSIIFLYLLFATLGYCLRTKTLTRIFGVVAIVVVAIAVLYSISNYGKNLIDNTVKVSTR